MFIHATAIIIIKKAAKPKPFFQCSTVKCGSRSPSTSFLLRLVVPEEHKGINLVFGAYRSHATKLLIGLETLLRIRVEIVFLFWSVGYYQSLS